MQKKSTRSTAIRLAVVGASLAGIAATAYFFFGPKGKKHQQHVRAWAIKMKGDVVEKLEAAQEITESAYLAIIDMVAKEYQQGKKASKSEIDAMADDLKKHWKSISKLAISTKKDLTEDASKVIKVVKRTSK